MPPVLRANVGGAKQLEIEGTTVGEVLDGLVAAYPALRDQLFTTDGDLNRFVNVYVNDQDIRYLQERATPVDPRDTLILLPAMAGGADRGWR
jgi:sulfur-carrier protein